MKELTVLISFKNEYEELARTCKSVRETAGDRVNIIALNDASDPGFDYEESVKDYDVKLFTIKTRKGSSLGKEFCVQQCETPYFLILDSHCRLTEGWLDKALEELKKDDKCIYCCKTIFFDDEITKLVGTPGFGAYFDYKPPHVLGVSWHVKHEGTETFEVPCILGANYLCSKEWWNYLKGFQGLRDYGREEPYISRKSWLLGGKVKCIPSIVTYHKQRKQNKFPYKVDCHEILHNEMVIAYTLMGSDWYKLNEFYSANCHPIEYRNAINALMNHTGELDALKAYYDKHKTLTIQQVDQINKQICTNLGINVFNK